MRLTRTIFIALVALLAIPVADSSAAPRTKFRPSAVGYTVSEGAGSATITVNKTRGGAASIKYTTRAGTATPGSDFTQVSGTLVFTGADTQKSFTIPVLEDSVQEGNETVLISFKPNKGISLANPKTRLTIIDNDGPARVSFENVAESASEQAGSHGISVVRAGDTASTVDATFAVTGGSAGAGNYSIGTSSPLHFAAGESAKTIDVAIHDNAAANGDRTVQLGLTGVTSSDPAASIQSPASTTLTILDDDVAPMIELDASSSWSVGEGDDVMLVTLHRTGSLADPASVQIQTTDGTAAAGQDYDAPTGDAVEFDAGESYVSLSIGINEDAIDEPAEQFDVTMLNPSGAALAAPVTRTVTIVDNDGAPTVVVEDPGADPDAGGSGTTDVTFTVVLSNPAATDVTVDYTIKDVDGNTVATGTVTIPAGQTTVTTTVPVTGEGPFTVEISNPSGGGTQVQPGGGSATTPGVGVGNPSTDPGPGSGTTDVTFEVDVTNPGDEDVTVDYEIRDADGNVVATGTVTVPAGESSVTVTVPVTGEGPFTVVINNPAGGSVNPGDGSTTTPTVDVGGVTTNPGSGSGTTDVTFDVEVTNPGGQPVTVDYEIVDGNGDVVGSGTVTVPAGDSSTTVTVPVTGEGPFTVVISNPTGGTIAPGGGSSSSTAPAPAGDGSGEGSGDGTDRTAGDAGSTSGTTAAIAAAGTPAADAPMAREAGILILGARLGGCKLTVGAFRSLRLLRSKAVKIKIHAVEACTGSIKAHVTGRKSKRGVKKGALQTKVVKYSLKAGQTKTIKLRFTKRGFALLKRALSRKKSLRASLLVRSVNPAKRVTLNTLRWTAKR